VSAALSEPDAHRYIIEVRPDYLPSYLSDYHPSILPYICHAVINTVHHTANSTPPLNNHHHHNHYSLTHLPRSNFYRSSPTVAHAYDPEGRCHYTFLHPAEGRDLLFALDVAKSADVLLMGVHYDSSCQDPLSGLIDAVR